MTVLFFGFHRNLTLVLSFNEFQIICTVKKHIMSGGPKRLPFTVPPLVFSALGVCLFVLLIVAYYCFLYAYCFLLK